MNNLAPIGLAGMVAAIPRLNVSARMVAHPSSAGRPLAGPTIVAPVAARGGMPAVATIDFPAESAEQLLARYQLALQALIARLYGQPIKSLIDIRA